MLYSADRYDISEQVLRTINRSSKENTSRLEKRAQRSEEEETIVEVDDTKDDRQKLLDERKAEREALLEEKRQKKLDAREAREKKCKTKSKKHRDNYSATRQNKADNRQLETHLRLQKAETDPAPKKT